MGWNNLFACLHYLWFICGYLWVICGCLWNICVFLCFFAVIYGLFVVICGYLWVICCYLWVICCYLWFFVVICGFLWVICGIFVGWNNLFACACALFILGNWAAPLRANLQSKDKWQLNLNKHNFKVLQSKNKYCNLKTSSNC